jgi:hypothetical protein
LSEEVKAALRTLSKEERRKYVENAVAQQLAKDKQRTVIVASLEDSSQQEWLESMVQGSKIPFRTRDGLSGSVQIFFEGSDTQEAEVKLPVLDEDSEPVSSETPRPIFGVSGSVYAGGGGSGLGAYPFSGSACGTGYVGGGLAPGSGVGGSVCSSGHGYGHGYDSSNETTKKEEIKNAETEGSQS